MDNKRVRVCHIDIMLHLFILFFYFNFLLALKMFSNVEWKNFTKFTVCHPKLKALNAMVQLSHSVQCFADVY